jgi:hypothetical protein
MQQAALAAQTLVVEAAVAAGAQALAGLAAAE